RTVASLKGDRAGQEVAFFALDRPIKGSIPILEEGEKRLQAGDSAREDRAALFHGLPADTKEPPATTVPLYEFLSPDRKQPAYSTERSWSEPGFRRAKRPLCLVWRNPMRLVVP